MTLQDIKGDITRPERQERGSSVGMAASSLCGTAGVPLDNGQGVAGKGAGSSKRGQIKMNMWQPARYRSRWQESGGEMRKLENT